MPMRVAIAGCHRMVQPQLAGHNFAAAFAAVPETAIVAVYDRGAETRADFVRCWGEMPAYDVYARMLREVQPDLLCIATRQTLHAAQIEEAAAAGVRGILCGKPLAISLLEADRIVAACRRHQIALAFALDRRRENARHSLLAVGQRITRRWATVPPTSRYSHYRIAQRPQGRNLCLTLYVV